MNPRELSKRMADLTTRLMEFYRGPSPSSEQQLWQSYLEGVRLCQEAYNAINLLGDELEDSNIRLIKSLSMHCPKCGEDSIATVLTKIRPDPYNPSLKCEVCGTEWRLSFHEEPSTEEETDS